MTPSPCINICRMDPQREYCIGCQRTLDEIATWSRLDDRARQDILAAIAARRLSAAAGEHAG